MPRSRGHRRVQDSPFEASLFRFAVSLELGLCLEGDTGTRFLPVLASSLYILCVCSSLTFCPT